jgi:hypothetical protein
MPYKFNPLSGQFDYYQDFTVPPGSGDVVGPAGSTPDNIVTFADGTGKAVQDSGVSINEILAYSETFVVGDWVGPSGGSYTITIPKTSHLQTQPECSVFELSGSDYIEVIVGVRVTTTDDVVLTVNNVPDNRFSGRIIIN